MTRIFRLIALAVVAAAVLAPTATPATEPAASCSAGETSPGCYHGKPIDPLATAYLASKGLTPAQIKDWTVGICAQGVEKPAVCFAPFEQTRTPAATLTSTGGFEWGDASIGAAATLGAVLLLAGLGWIVAMSRHGRRRPVASA